MEEYIIKKGTAGYYGRGGFWRFMRYARISLTATTVYIRPLLVFLPIFKKIIIPLSNINNVELQEQSKWAGYRTMISSQRSSKWFIGRLWSKLFIHYIQDDIQKKVCVQFYRQGNEEWKQAIENQISLGRKKGYY